MAESREISIKIPRQPVRALVIAGATVSSFGVIHQSMQILDSSLKARTARDFFASDTEIEKYVMQMNEHFIHMMYWALPLFLATMLLVTSLKKKPA